MIAAYWLTSKPSRLAWSEGRQPLSIVLHLTDELDELLQLASYLINAQPLPAHHPDADVNSLIG